jgi:hypothetical protein
MFHGDLCANTVCQSNHLKLIASNTTRAAIDAKGSGSCQWNLCNRYGMSMTQCRYPPLMRTTLQNAIKARLAAIPHKDVEELFSELSDVEPIGQIRSKQNMKNSPRARDFTQS